jgi:hypothetical protein
VPLGVSGAEASGGLISEDLLDHAYLGKVWETTLPVKAGEGLDSVTLLEGRLYVRSSENYMWSIDGASGEVIFGQSVARPGFLLLGWTSFGDRLISVIDNQLIEFDRDSGVRQRVSDLELDIVAPPVRNSRFVYVSASDCRLHALRTPDMVEMFEASARNGSEITSVLADEDMVVLGTEGGNLIAVTADAPRKLWQFDAGGAMAGPVVRDGQSFYFASKDTHVYRVDIANPTAASLIWMYQTEAILDRPPRVTATAVYQYARGHGVTAIDKQSGKALWSLPEGVDLLAEGTGKAYVFTKVGTLAVMDNSQGRPLYSVNFGPVTDYATNTTDALIYVADDHGRVTCLRPIRHRTRERSGRWTTMGSGVPTQGQGRRS